MTDFPILSGSAEGDRQREVFGASVPWKAIEVVRDDAQAVHGQTLETLAARGGLTWCEIGSLFVRHFS